MKLINLTQHQATPEQVAAGVLEPSDKSAVQSALTFAYLPGAAEITDRAVTLARIAQESGCKAAMIGGAPYLMAPLEAALRAAGIRPLYSFTERVSVEETLHDGSVKKTNVFRHVGFVQS